MQYTPTIMRFVVRCCGLVNVNLSISQRITSLALGQFRVTGHIAETKEAQYNPVCILSDIWSASMV